MGEYKEVSTKVQLAGQSACKLYKMRWVVLAVFCSFSMVNAMQWIQYSIIANIITRYYDVSSIWVDWTSMIYMVTYIILIVPGSWAMDSYGLRKCVIVGTGGNCIGALIKSFSASEDGFLIGFLGQSLVAAAQVFILSVPSRLAALWFGPEEVSSACSIGIFGNLLGIAFGFVLPPIMVPNNDDLRLIGENLSFMFNCVSALSTAIFLLVIIFFKAAPPMPPSHAQALLKSKPIETFSHSLVHLIKNYSYILLLISYGINVGVFCAISTLLNQIILTYFPGAEVHAGRVGLTMVITGVIVSVMSGILLDKTHKFKETTLGLYTFSLIGMAVFTFTLSSSHIALVYFTVGLLGFFMTSYMPVGVELAAELTYPEPEATSAGLFNGVVQIFGIAFTSLYGIVLKYLDVFWCNIVMCIFLILGTFLTIVISPHMKRQAAQKLSVVQLDGVKI